MRCALRTLDLTDTAFVRTKSLSAAVAFLRTTLQRPPRLDLFWRIGGQQLGARWRVVARPRLKTRFLYHRGRSSLRFDKYRAAPGHRPCFASSLAGNLLSFRRTQRSAASGGVGGCRGGRRRLGAGRFREARMSGGAVAAVRRGGSGEGRGAEAAAGRWEVGRGGAEVAAQTLRRDQEN
ncbi:hypothetical protein GUJ93_ZPchr0010g9665 [Zizania palustris]|uniref:Uncharacterized protein n=1 Tax=Zizania palustris TaxID=103762 RepID=A0A8J5WGN1_ZIZPA|nr:hypothetical protein GUJ93_ZPchr0010g9665 [Zizania palustris]